MNDNATHERPRVIFSHSGGPRPLISQVAEELRKAFPTCDVTEIENPPPCVKCGQPAVAQVDGADLCGTCGEIKVELVVTFRDAVRSDSVRNAVAEVAKKFTEHEATTAEPKYANLATRRHAEPGQRFEPAAIQIRGRSAPASRNEACPCGSGRKFKNCCRLELVGLDTIGDSGATDAACAAACSAACV